MVKPERGVIHSGAYSRWEITHNASDLVPTPGLHILRGASALIDISNAAAECVAAENPLGESLVEQRPLHLRTCPEDLRLRAQYQPVRTRGRPGSGLRRCGR